MVNTIRFWFGLIIFGKDFSVCRIERSAAIWRAAVRETGASRHRGAQLREPPLLNDSEHHRNMISRGLSNVIEATVYNIKDFTVKKVEFYLR